MVFPFHRVGLVTSAEDAFAMILRFPFSRKTDHGEIHLGLDCLFFSSLYLQCSTLPSRKELHAF